jgi:hypothetical protein
MEDGTGAEYYESADVQLSPLHEAVGEGDLSSVKALVAAGADIEEKVHGSVTPLHRAAFKGHVAVARCLVERGANVQVNGGDGPLHAAARKGHTKLARLLIEHGADKNAHNDRQWTPLDEAICYEQLAVAEYLLEQGCEVDPAAVRCLVEHGAIVQVTTS